MQRALTLDPGAVALTVQALAQGADNCGYDPACIYAGPIVEIYRAAIGYDPLREGWNLQEACEVLKEYFPA